MKRLRLRRKTRCKRHYADLNSKHHVHLKLLLHIGAPLILTELVTLTLAPAGREARGTRSHVLSAMRPVSSLVIASRHCSACGPDMAWR